MVTSFSVLTIAERLAARMIDALGLERIMFEAADPAVFAWYVKQYGAKEILEWLVFTNIQCPECGVPEWAT